MGNKSSYIVLFLSIFVVTLLSIIPIYAIFGLDGFKQCWWYLGALSGIAGCIYCYMNDPGGREVFAFMLKFTLVFAIAGIPLTSLSNYLLKQFIPSSIANIITVIIGLFFIIVAYNITPEEIAEMARENEEREKREARRRALEYLRKHR